MTAPLTESETTISNDQQLCAVLIVSACLEHRRTLLRILEGRNIEALVCSTLAQARGALSKRTAAVTFCDEKLPDGTYSDFLELPDREQKTSRVIVTMMNDGWESYLEAIRLGAFDVLQFPFAPTDWELSLIHAMREARDKQFGGGMEARTISCSTSISTGRTAPALEPVTRPDGPGSSRVPWICLHV